MLFDFGADVFDVSVATTPEGKRINALIATLDKLKRRDRLDEAEHLLLGECERQEAASAATGLSVASLFYEQLAVLYARQGRYADELAILNRFDLQVKEPGQGPRRLHARLQRSTVKAALPKAGWCEPAKASSPVVAQQSAEVHVIGTGAPEAAGQQRRFMAERA